jgi:hypothetical protein
MGMDQPPTQPPMGGSKPPDFGEMGDKLKAAQGPDRLLLIAGVLFLIATFLPWWRVRVAGFGAASENAWGVGGLGVLAALFGLATLVFAAAAITGALKPNPSFGLMALALAGGTLLFTLLRFLFKPGGSASTAAEALSRGAIKISRGIGLWGGIVFAILMAIAAFQKYQASNG